MIKLNSGTLSTNSYANIQTKKALRYSPGLGALARFTAVFTQGVAQSQQFIGIGDDTDGFFFGYKGTQFSILYRKDDDDAWIPQTDWNIDPMDGTGPSGVILNPTLGNVYQINFQWLGFGQITFSIENPNTGQYIRVHAIRYANTENTPSIYNPTLPLQAMVSNNGAAADVSLYTASAMGFIEGPSFTQAISTRYSYTNTVNINSKDTDTIFTLRNNPLYNTKTNRVRVRFDYISCATNTSNLSVFNIIRVKSVSGGSFTDINPNQSVMQYSTNTTITPGSTLLTQAVSEGSSTSNIISELEIFLAPGDYIAIQATPQGTGDLTASLSWVEYY